MDSKNYTQVLIDGKIYTLGGSEEEAYLQKAASYVNDKNAQMRRLPAFSKQSADYQMIMTELNIADDYFKALEWAEDMECQKNNMEKETYSLKHELVSTQMKLEAVLKDLEDRQRELDRLSRASAQLEGELKESREELERSREELEEYRNKEREAAERISAAEAPVKLTADAAIVLETETETEEVRVEEQAEEMAAVRTDGADQTDGADRTDGAVRTDGVNRTDGADQAGGAGQAAGNAAAPASQNSMITNKVITVEEARSAREVKMAVTAAMESAGQKQENAVPTVQSAGAGSAEAATSGTTATTAAANEAAASLNTGISDEELAKKALQAAKKANSHRGRR